MWGVGSFSVLFAVVAFCCCGDVAFATTNIPIIATSVAARPDSVEMQALALDWLRQTIGSPQFAFGVAVGVIAAEGLRFCLRGLLRTVAFVSGTAQLVVRYRLMVCGLLAAGAYAVTHWVIA
jgi:hypothetical protein